MVKEELLKLSTFNCRGLGQGSKRRTVMNWLKKYHDGVILLQETHTVELVEQIWRSEWKGQVEFCHGKSSARGVATLISNKLNIQINKVIRDNTGRFLLLDTTFENQPLIIINIYAPTKDQQELQLEFLSFVHDRLLEFSDKNILLGGDFNTCLDPTIDKKGGSNETPSKSSEKIQSLMEDYNLIDVWRFINYDSRRFTRREMSRNGLVQSRLDYWLISNHLLYDYHSQDIAPGLKSDHSLVTIALKIACSQQKGRGFFKFNSALLKDAEYIKEVKSLIEKFKADHIKEENRGLFWDALKSQIRGFTIGYASARSKRRNAYEKELKERLQALEDDLDDHSYLEYTTIKRQLEQINQEIALGIQLRSKAKLVEETEQNLSFFSKEETRNYNLRYIRSLITDGNNIISDPKCILQEQEKFYKKLYTKPAKQTLNHDLFEINIPQLTTEDQALCEDDITIGELGKALCELPNNKSPGTDGLTSEFYKFFWPDIKLIVYDSLTYAYTHNTLSIEQKRGILTIIPKKDKDLRRLTGNNWRPLSLLNTDYKILTKLLASRLQKVIGKLISYDQSGYIKGRFIGENIRTIYDIIDYARNHMIPGMVVAIDFQKAFDSVSWEFLLQTLRSFNFGPNFTKWINIIYSSPQCCVTNNGYHSNFFTLSRGIRQGCPISALLFLLVVEIMAIHIRSNNKIEGIKISDSQDIVITQLADDTTLFLKDTSSLNEALAFIETFGESSGLRLNKDKSESFWIGSKLNSMEKPLGLKWTKNYIKCLGIWCGADVEGAMQINYEEKLRKLRTLLNMWSQRKLSLKGKVAVLRSLALPQILYVASSLYVPEWVIHEVDSIFFSFLWSRKKAHVKKETVINEIGKGGLKMPLFSGMLRGIKCSWIKRLVSCNRKYELLKHFVSYKDYTIDRIIQSRLDLDFVNVSSPFYSQVLGYWYEMYSLEPIHAQEVNSFPLWNNKFIIIENKPVHYIEWEKNGIECIGDLVNQNCMILTKRQLERRYNLQIKQMDYNSLIHSIPKLWLNIIQGKNPEYFDISTKIKIKDKMKDIKDMTCKDVYWQYISTVGAHPTAEKKWADYIDVDNDEWEHLHVIPYRVCRETYLQSFQYKIMNRFFPCNYTLSKWYNDHSPKCTQCDSTDYLEHYFYLCEHVKSFFQSVEKWWLSTIEVSMKLNAKYVLLGIPNHNEDKFIDIFNLCILYAKWYIYQCKLNHQNLFIMDYIKFVKEKLHIEETWCLINNSKDFENRWGAFYNLM